MELEDTSECNRHPLVIRGRVIRADRNGLICLNDIWSAAGFSKHRRPSDWLRLETTNPRIQRVLKLVTNKSGNYDKADILRVFKRRVGVNAGAWADVRLALDYAEFLSPALAIEVKEVFLRYKAADATLADEIMQRADAEANEWMAKRSLGRAARLTYTGVLKVHGLQEPKEYAQCTNATYIALYGRDAAQLKKEKGLPARSNLRDGMDTKELITVSFAEILSSERIEDEDCQGFVECRDATSRVGRAVRTMIDMERKDRQPRLT